MEKQDSFDVSYNEMVPVFFCVFRVVIVQNKALHMRNIVGVFTYERSSLERQKHLRGLTFFFGVGFFGYFQENLIRKNKRMKKVVSVTL